MSQLEHWQNSGTSDIASPFQRRSLSSEEMCSSFRALLADRCVDCRARAVPTVRGAQVAIAMLEGFRADYELTTINVELLNLERCGKVLFSKRIDHLVDSSGARFISHPVAGVMRLDEDDRVAYWRDYWDMREFLTLPQTSDGG